MILPQLGDRVRDRVTEVEGIATAQIFYLNGCVQFCVTPKTDGAKPPESNDARYIDWQRLEVIECDPFDLAVSVTEYPLENVSYTNHRSVGGETPKGVPKNYKG